VGDIIASKSDLLEPHSHTHIVSLSCVAAYLLDLLSDALTVHPHAYFIEKYTHTHRHLQDIHCCNHLDCILFSRQIKSCCHCIYCAM